MLVSRYGSREAFMEAMNPDAQRAVCRRAEECYFGDYPTLSTLGAAYGANAPVMWLIPQLYNLSEYCGCKEKLQGNPLRDCASVIATEFYYLKVTEVMLFFHRFKAGWYGRFYGAIDPLLITTSLRAFLKERREAHARREQERLEQQQREAARMAVTRAQYLALLEEALQAHRRGADLTPQQQQVLNALTSTSAPPAPSL